MKIDNNLIKRYNSGECSDEERLFVEEWYLSYEGGEVLEPNELESGLNNLDKLMNPLLDESTQKRSFIFRFSYALRIAAILFLISSITLIVYVFNKEEKEPGELVYNIESPTGSRSIISLGSGETLHLDSLQPGKIYSTDHFTIELMEDGELKYTSNGKQTGKASFNTIQAAIGGFVRLSLPDGTKVWLNSASKLTYPAVFSDETREVQLMGEAYFEVSRTKEKADWPFVVRTDVDVIEVLGTHFNVSAYPEDETRKVSLLEGKVAVYSSKDQFDDKLKQPDVVLTPGQQYQRKGELVKIVTPVSIGSVLDWKNNYFTFTENSFEDIAKKISRWYGVEISYKYDIPQEIYYGEISRQKDITTVLELLAAVSNVHFELIGNKVVITYHNLD